MGALAVALAVLHCLHDPLRPWWSVGAILAVGLAAGLLAVWLRRPAYVWLSCLLLNLAGTILWWSWADAAVSVLDWNLPTVVGLVEANVLALAIGSLVWTLIGVLHRPGVPHIQRGGHVVPTAHAAAQLAACLLGTMVAIGVLHELLGLEHLAPQRLAWIALAAVALAAAVCLWEREGRFVLPVLYGLALTALGMELLALGLSSRRTFCASAAVELAAFALLAAVAGWIVRRARPVWRTAGIAMDQRRG